MNGKPHDRARDAAKQLLAYCQANDWAGYDPYDALNSELFRLIPFLDSKWPRIALTQALKRSPVNVRRLALIPKTQNPKGFALFLGAMLKMSRAGALCDEHMITAVIEKLIALRSPNSQYWCWGYSFPWQTRTLIVPRGAPNLVCTTFVANALLDAYEARGDRRLLEMAKSAVDYLVNDLYWTDGPIASLSYPTPSVRTPIHNANLLGAGLLCRMYKHTGDTALLEPAIRVARYSANQQLADGSWYYGEAPTQRWIDNFHTGYNLSGLNTVKRALNTQEFDGHIERGFDFYRRHFIREDGAPRYFHDRTYPIDVHCVSQTIITMLEFRALDETAVAHAGAVVEWALGHMWDPRGYFYYRVLPAFTVRTSYMRWSQAWMLVALATFLEEGRPTSRVDAGAITTSGDARGSSNLAEVSMVIH